MVLNFDSNLTTPDLPPRLFNAGTQRGQTLTAAAVAAHADRNQVKQGNQALRANQAVFFTWRQQTYLSVNNSQILRVWGFLRKDDGYSFGLHHIFIKKQYLYIQSTQFSWQVYRIFNAAS